MTIAAIGSWVAAGVVVPDEVFEMDWGSDGAGEGLAQPHRMRAAAATKITTRNDRFFTMRAP